MLALEYEAWLAADSAERCGGCGTKEADWVDPESRRPWSNPMWKATVKICPGCARISDAHKAASGVASEDDRPALRAHLVENLDAWTDDDGVLHPG